MIAEQRLRALVRRYSDFVSQSGAESRQDQEAKSTRSLVRAARIIHAVANDLTDGQLSLWAMSLVYTTVLSLVPLLAAAFAVLKGFGVHNEIKPALLTTLEPIGPERHDLVDRIIEFVDRIQVGVLGAIGLAFLLYSVFAMVHKVEKSFNYTWRLTKSRSMARRFSDYLSVLMIGPLLIFLSVGAAGTFQSKILDSLAGLTTWVAPLILLAGWLLPWLLMTAGFTFVYMFVPNTKVKFRSALVGGATTTVVWKAMGWVFSLVVADSANTAAVYSAFASAIVLLVWIYLGWYVLLTGASIAYYHQHSSNAVVPRRDTRYSQHEREAIAVATMLKVGEAFAQSRPVCTIDSLALQLNVAIDEVQRVVTALIEGGWLIRARDPEHALPPAKPLATIEMSEILDFLGEYTGSRAHPQPHFGASSDHERVSQLLGAARSARSQALVGQTLQQLIGQQQGDETSDPRPQDRPRPLPASDNEIQSRPQALP